MNKQTRILIPLLIATGLSLIPAKPEVQAALLLAQSDSDGGYGYGLSTWDNFTAEIDEAFNDQVTVTPDLNNLSQMLTFEALLLNQRGPSGSLGATEATNIAIFAATGRRVLMIGENDSWSAWNNQILAIVGGSYAGEVNTAATRLVEHDITNGAPTLQLPLSGTAGQALGGTALYNPNFATLWGDNQNVLTVLDVNVWDDRRWNTNNGGVFGANVAAWLAVPEPTSLALALAGLCLPLSRLARWRAASFRAARVSDTLPSVCLVACLHLLVGPFAYGTTITFDEFPADNSNGPMPATRYAYLGVTFSGLDDGSTWGGISNGDPGNWDLEGTNGPVFSGYNGGSYAMTLTTAGVFSSFRLDVSRSAGSSDTDTFTLDGYSKGVMTDTVTVPLNTINVWTTVSLSWPVDEVRWSGSGTGFHPYGIDNLRFEIVPEPTSIALALAGLCLPLRRRFRHRAAGFRAVRASGSLLSACLVACLLSLGTSLSDANAAVITQLLSPGEMTSPTLINDFETVKDNADVTFNATSTLITASAATEGVTPSGLRGLSEEDENEPLTAILASPAFEIGMWFGNDDFGLVFNAVLEVFAGAASLGSVSLPSNANDYADQFIGLRSNMAFDEVRISYERPAAEGLSIYIDDFYVGVPEPASAITLIAGRAAVGNSYQSTEQTLQIGNRKRNRIHPQQRFKMNHSVP